MEIHYFRPGNDLVAVCGQPVLDAPDGVYFSSRHDQATCEGCKAASPF